MQFSHFPRADSFFPRANVYILFSTVIKWKHRTSFVILIIFHRLFNLFIITPKSIWASSYVPASTAQKRRLLFRISFDVMKMKFILIYSFIFFLWRRKIDKNPLKRKNSFVMKIDGKGASICNVGFEKCEAIWDPMSNRPHPQLFAFLR